MLLGHFGVALAGKRLAPRVSLGWLFAACQFADLLWPVLVLLGVERLHVEPGNTAFTPLAFDHYPWSHSLVMDVAWGAALGLLYFALRRDARGAWVIAALVLSHWVLDWITHRPDLPLVPGGDTRVGLGLWNHVRTTVALECAIYLGATWWYVHGSRGTDRVGRLGFWVLVAFLFAVYASNVLSPPPASALVVAWSALAMWALIPIAAWVDRHRT